MIGVLVFLLLVLLMYRAALSPSTVGVALGNYNQHEPNEVVAYQLAYEDPSKYSQTLHRAS
jgi:hypothetical protein